MVGSFPDSSDFFCVEMEGVVFGGVDRKEMENADAADEAKRGLGKS